MASTYALSGHTEAEKLTNGVPGGLIDEHMSCAERPREEMIWLTCPSPDKRRSSTTVVLFSTTGPGRANAEDPKRATVQVKSDFSNMMSS